VKELSQIPSKSTQTRWLRHFTTTYPITIPSIFCPFVVHSTSFSCHTCDIMAPIIQRRKIRTPAATQRKKDQEEFWSRIRHRSLSVKKQILRYKEKNNTNIPSIELQNTYERVRECENRACVKHKNWARFCSALKATFDGVL